MTCICHPFLLNGQCLSQNEEQCVSFPSLVRYNHLDTLPIAYSTVYKIWCRAFKNKYQTTDSYPSWLHIKDMFEDVDSKAMSEARLAAAFIKDNVPVNVDVE